MNKEYDGFLQSKVLRHSSSARIECNGRLNNYSKLFDFQKFIVKHAIERGKYAIFADCGLGKTIMQLVWANEVSKHTNKPVLILAPLAVSGQTINEGKKFDIKVFKHGNFGDIQITNYEQLDNINVSAFSGIVLDESSIIKNFEGKYRNKIMESFQSFDFKLACTATPSPNDPMELGNHSEFLDVLSRNEMLSMFFVHDGGNTSKWRLKGHSVDEFYKWVSTWAIMLSNPKDINFQQDGFDLPELNLIERKVETPKKDNGMLFNDIAVNATNFNQELRITIKSRLERVVDIVNKSDEQFIVWIKQNEEGRQLIKLIPDAIEVRGDHNRDYKENKLLGFAKNEFRVLITKSKIAQFGLNYQNCHNQVFAGLDFSFESLYQSIRRSYRFGQKQPVNVYIITTDTMQNVISAISEKRRRFQEMQEKLSQAICDKIEDSNGNGIAISNKKTIIKELEYELRLGDCVKLIKDVISESIDFSVFSPPFAELYVYSDKIEDMGNCKNYEEFKKHFSYLIPELLRVLRPGRLIAVHCSDLPIRKGVDGYIGLRDFSGSILKLFESVGFIYHSRITIWKDPVVEMQRTKALGLLHKQIKKDSTMSRVGLPDYVLIFRKHGENFSPISNSDMPVEVWQEWASPIWMDINQSDTLQRQSVRSEKDEKHICPLQLDVIKRLTALYSNQGDLVFSPFTGIGSEGYQAVLMGRRFLGFELKDEYFNQATKNLKYAKEKKNQGNLFEIF